ncbi:DegT/DnrJ/EryC1/StrS family aminotransferase [Aestuariivirga sp.]|jgi:dTDP-4-amino-4,6-dideoxygalactose transaminase|uniref:DegT/DnrJ/EryC1/StrS family aminotransferase n=1 Tax=Aestuariivirga sp. TaxID=2650926 RepID=UPI003782E75B
MVAVIPLNDLRRIHEPLLSEFSSCWDRVMTSGWFLRGRETEKFEAEWAEYCGQAYCVSCASGTDALTIAAIGLGLKRAVIQGNTLPLTAIALYRAGVHLELSDVEPDGRILSHAPETVPVLLYGRLPQGREVERRLYDAAHAHGWRPHQNAVACWSFYPTKTLGALGDAGAITTNDQGLAELMRDLAGRDDVFRDGRQMTSRMDEVQAAILSVKLKALPSWIAARQEIGQRYLSDLPQTINYVSNARGDLNHLAVIKLKDRDRLAGWLRACGVETKVHFPVPLHKQAAPWGHSAVSLPAVEEWCSSVLTLPCFPGLTKKEQSLVVEAIVRFEENQNGADRSA